MNSDLDAFELRTMIRPRSHSSRHPGMLLAMALVIGGSSAGAYSPAFCPNDTFPLDARLVRAAPVPYRVFERLSPLQFPRTADAVRVEAVSATKGNATIDAFHRRSGNVGFASRVTARRDLDERTGLRRLHLSREDDACMSAGISAHLLPVNSLCARVEAVELMRDAWTLNFQHALVNHQLQFTLIRSLEAEDSWTMVPSKRRGEPERLQLELGGDEERLRSRWSVLDQSKGLHFETALDVEIPARDLAEARFDTFELGLLGSLDLLDELSDLHRDWVVYAEQVDTMEPVPEPGEDFYGCEPSDGVCSAEYDTCIPTHDGWLGCNYDPTEPGWGGGLHGDGGGGDGGGNGGGNGGGDGGGDGGGGDDSPEPLPDWQPGSALTNPRFPSPLFHGMHIDYDANGNATNFGFSYDLTSVLQKKSTVPKPFAYPPHPLGTHPFGYFLTRDGSDDVICGLVRLNRTSATTIPIGDARTYRSPDSLCERETILRCTLDSGIHVLHYHLDLEQQWDEGSEGEANNVGIFRGYHIED